MKVATKSLSIDNLWTKSTLQQNNDDMNDFLFIHWTGILLNQPFERFKSQKTPLMDLQGRTMVQQSLGH